jgi:hypothetical protein
VLLIYGVVSTFKEYLNTTRKNREAISDMNKEVYLEIHADIFRYVLMCHDRNTVQKP